MILFSPFSSLIDVPHQILLNMHDINYDTPTMGSLTMFGRAGGLSSMEHGSLFKGIIKLSYESSYPRTKNVTKRSLSIDLPEYQRLHVISYLQSLLKEHVISKQRADISFLTICCIF
jgi:hypothetical protein